MNERLKIIVLTLLIILTSLQVKAQIETTELSQERIIKDTKSIFFTNRPIIVNKDSSVTFKNKSTKQTNKLHFCTYDFENDSIELYYSAVNHSEDYPTGKIDKNIFYDMYEFYRLNRGIKNFYFIVGGYGKSFKKQVNSYMKRLKSKYGDALFGKAVIITYAWGVEDDAWDYYHAVSASKNGAADFAIFQHMMDEFVSDENYFKTHPKDFNFEILFSSMGNHLFRKYLEKREKQKIPLVKAYNRVLFVGSVAPQNSFEEGEVFYNLNQMTDTVDVFVNSKDGLLKMSSVAHLKGRLGNKGPRDEEDLPGYINVWHIENLMGKEDKAGMGHDYLLTNPIIQEIFLKSMQQK